MRDDEDRSHVRRCGGDCSRQVQTRIGLHIWMDQTVTLDDQNVWSGRDAQDFNSYNGPIALTYELN